MNALRLMKSLLAGLWRVLDGVRKALHLVFLLFFVIILLASVASKEPRMPREAALIIAPQGVLVDQLSGDPF